MLAATILVAIIAFLTIFVPGMLLALALLRKTELNLFEISVIGFILGFMETPTVVWLESYLMNTLHFFSFSLGLYLLNAIALSIIGFALCVWQGVFKDFKKQYIAGHDGSTIRKMPQWVLAVLLFIMLLTFITRIQGIATAPTFFEFDPYFDMIDTNYILTYGQQLLLDPSAWPSVPGGTNHRIEPLIPYTEAFWYSLSNSLGSNYQQLNTTLMSLVGSVYPPIVAVLLVFAIFVLVYHEYNEHIALIAAALTATMPVLLTTFIAGEQLVEPWGIFAMFFFIMAYMLCVRNPKNTRLAILAGIAYIANFVGAHYYTVTMGVFVAYMLLQGTVDILRGTTSKDFYRSNAIIILMTIVFLAVYLPYSSTLQNRIPSVGGIPLTLAGPVLALLAIAVIDYLPREMVKRKILISQLDFNTRLASFVVLGLLSLILIAVTPLGKAALGYINLSSKFTTPSSPLFMTVEEYIPTGLTYNFGAQGFGVIGASTFGLPLIIWIVCLLALALIAISVYYRKSRTGILYMAIALPLMFAGFSEVKYLPHFGVAYIIFIAIILGELIYMSERKFAFREFANKEVTDEQSHGILSHTKYTTSATYAVLLVGLFFVSSLAALLYAAYLALTAKKAGDGSTTSTTPVFNSTAAWLMFGIFAVIMLIGYLSNHTIIAGESGTFYDAINSAVVVSTTPPSQVCTAISNRGLSMGYAIYCNSIPQYWLNSMAWIKQNVGPNAPRVLAWWDYGDWINWFGNSNAFLRGDNANAIEDYATAAHYVLGDKYNPQSLANFMNTNQSKYVLFDQDLISKWGALDFLGCVYANETSQAFAVAQGQASSNPQPYLLGTSSCEQAHDPQFALIPLAALVPSNQSQSINFYCSISTNSTPYVQAPLIIGQNYSNQSVCVDINPNKNGVLSLYNSTGKKLNAVIQSSFYLGVVNVGGTPYVEYMMIYLPGANGTVVNPPSQFYTSNYYRGFILGKLPGFTQVYPQNATGINFVNGTYAVRIYALNNFTGQLPPVPVKPSWIHNNYSMP